MVELPLLVDMSSVSLSVEERQLLLTTPTEYHLVPGAPSHMARSLEQLPHVFNKQDFFPSRKTCVQ